MNIDPRLEMIKLRHTQEYSVSRGKREELLREALNARRIARMEMRQRRRMLILHWAKQIIRLRIRVTLAPVEEVITSEMDNLKGSGVNSGIHLNQV